MSYNAGRQPFYARESFAESFSNYDVIDPRIDVSAQKALIRLRGNPATSADAAQMLAAVKGERLQGIFGDDLRAAAQLAARLGTVRWELVPRGQVAALIREPNPAAPPTIIFRTQYRGDAARLDPALVAAWRSSLAPPPVVIGGTGMFFDEVYGYVTVAPRGSTALAGPPRMMPSAEVASMTARRAASTRRAPEAEAEVLGPSDDRRVVRNTFALPNRFVCKLLVAFDHPLDSNSTFLMTGTGILIGRRHVLTAAHMVFMNRLTGRRQDGSLFQAVIDPETPSILFVVPGSNGPEQPFGHSVAARTRFPPAYEAPPPKDIDDVPPNNAELDFGLITLADPLGSLPVPALGSRPLGHWGSASLGGGTRVVAQNVQALQGRQVTVTGYPGDKCGDRPAVGSATKDELRGCAGRTRGTMQWQAVGNVLQPSHPLAPALLIHNADAVQGQSGGPVWTDGLNLVAVHTGGSVDPNDPTKVIANRAVRITEPVLAQLREWMRADGETPSF